MNSLLQLVATRPGLRKLGTNTFIAFGLISALMQFYSALFTPEISSSWAWWIFGLTVFTSLTYGTTVSFPKRRITQWYRHPKFAVTIAKGDLFDPTNELIAVGFADTFDTDVTSNRIIHQSSVQGQLLARVYGGDIARLDDDIQAQLAKLTPSHSESASDKDGKLIRYPLGTVLALRAPGRLVLASAYSRMENDLRVQATLDSIWTTLSAVWDAADRAGSLARISVPVFGSELARVHSLGRDGLIRIIAASFVARSRLGVVSTELEILVHPKDFAEVNMVELGYFLRSL